MEKVILSLIIASTACLLASAGSEPAVQDYSSFSQFIAARNIFNPNRQPLAISAQNGVPPGVPQSETSRLQLVGTMGYEKGMFAFFNGTTMNLSAVVQVGDNFHGYTVAAIAANRVSLASADTKEQHELRIGDGLRHENGGWELFDSQDSSAMGSGSAASDSSDTKAIAPRSATEQNDILKRLMQQREKENQ
jgi:hypothetical protein